MKCVICRHGETAPGLVTFPLTTETTTLLFREVPAEVCTNCGEEYVGSEVASRLFKIVEEASKSGVEIDVRKYIAA